MDYITKKRGRPRTNSTTSTSPLSTSSSSSLVSIMGNDELKAKFNIKECQVRLTRCIINLHTNKTNETMNMNQNKPQQIAKPTMMKMLKMIICFVFNVIFLIGVVNAFRQFTHSKLLLDVEKFDRFHFYKNCSMQSEWTNYQFK
jgi:hypothetical protein